MRSNRVELHASPAAERKMTKPVWQAGPSRGHRPQHQTSRERWQNVVQMQNEASSVQPWPKSSNPGALKLACFQLPAAVGKLRAEVVWGKNESNPF